MISPSDFPERFTLCLRDQQSMWMQDGCKAYMDSYMASNGSCFMVTWIVIKNYLLEVGLAQNREIVAFECSQPLVYFSFYHVWGYSWIEFHWTSIWLRAPSLYTTLEGPWPQNMVLEVCWDGLWTLSCGRSQVHGHGSWLVCEVALILFVLLNTNCKLRM
jgi:hypothetical protein